MNAEYLAHHGIKGQRWGVRNGPPYPLDNSKQSSASSHSNMHEKFANLADYYINKYRNKDISGVDPATIAVLTYFTTTLAMPIAIKVHSDIAYNKEIKNNKKSSFDIQKKINGPHSKEDDQEAINPDFTNGKDMGSKVNCTMCSAAYELRRRGFDVKSQKSVRGRKPADAAKWFSIPESDIKEFSTKSSFERALLKEPDGSRGMTFTSVDPFGTHHCMVWEKENGTITIRDCQSNDTYSSIKDSIISSQSMRIPYRYIRTDNASINWDEIQDAVTERK